MQVVHLWLYFPMRDAFAVVPNVHIFNNTQLWCIDHVSVIMMGLCLKSEICHKIPEIYLLIWLMNKPTCIEFLFKRSGAAAFLFALL